MATSDFLGLFTTPEQYQQAQRQAQEAQAIQFANLNPMARANYGTFLAGQQLGGAIGGALGGEDPQLKMISQRQQILGMIDPTNPDSFAQGIQMALQTGDTQTAFLLRNEMMKAKEQAQQQEIRGFEREKFLLDRGMGMQQRQMEARALSIANGIDPDTGLQGKSILNEKGEVVDTQALKPLFDPTTKQFNEDVANKLISEYGQVGANIVKQRLEGASVLRPEYKEVNGVLYEMPKFGEGQPKAVTEAAKKTITIGNRVLDANTMAVLYTAPDAPPAALAEWKAFTALPENEKQSFLKLQAAKRPSTTITMPNEGERKAATLANRLNFSVDQINQAIGIDPSAAMPTTSVEIARFLSRTEFIPNKLTSAQRQIVESAQLDILDAALTLGTGAAYTREQLEGYRKSYFPQINDKPENVAAKRARLQNILKSAEIASGRAKVPTPIPSSGADLSSIINAPPSN
jgi:hypothetical protein